MEYADILFNLTLCYKCTLKSSIDIIPISRFQNTDIRNAASNFYRKLSDWYSTVAWCKSWRELFWEMNKAGCLMADIMLSGYLKLVMYWNIFFPYYSAAVTAGVAGIGRLTTALASPPPWVEKYISKCSIDPDLPWQESNGSHSARPPSPDIWV